jgi:CRISPR-associated Csh1 family protein
MLHSLLAIGESQGTEDSVGSYHSPSKSFGQAEVFIVSVKLSKVGTDSKVTSLIPVQIEKIEFSRDDNSSLFLYTDRDIERSKPNATKSINKNRIHDFAPLSGIRMVVDFAFNTLGISSIESKSELIHWIDERIKSAMAQIPPIEIRNTQYLVTLQVEATNELGVVTKKYLGELASTRNTLAENFVETIARNHVCAVCNEKKDSISQYNLLGLYTLDRPGFAPHGHREYGSSLFPICNSCVGSMIRAEKWIGEYASFRLFNGINYFVIPVVNYPPPKSPEYSIGLKHFLNLFENTFESLVKVGITDLFDIEDKIVQSINAANQIYSKWNVTLTYFFYVRSNSARVVRLRLDGILPSRLSEIVSSLRSVASSESIPNFNFRDFSAVFVNPKVGTMRLYGRNNPGESKMLFEILEKVHLGPSAGKLNQSMIIQSLMRNVRGLYGLHRREGTSEKKLLMDFEQYMRNTLAALVFLYVVSSAEEMTVLSSKSDSNVTSVQGNTTIDKYFQSHSQLFQNPAKSWAFLIGVVTRKLIEFQLKERQSEGLGSGRAPFLSNIGDMNFNPKRLQALYKAVIEKFASYDKALQYFEQRVSYLSEMVAAAATPDISVSDDELSYFFALGFASGSKF